MVMTDPIRILIVDDEPANIQILHAAVSTLGPVQFARSGEQALKLATANPPDVVLLDVVMPDLDGFAVTRALRADPATAGVMVVLVSGSAADADVERGLECGADDFIAKPVAPALIRQRVRLLAELARRRR
ncbi:Response regulator PleD [Magnetospirillum gryphiswaldense MSR-1]|nr:Response regulator PleD [Magnetospirillum gryphiswaldense MSR-1]AVM77950.1 Response regulator PleD [Magnetospirillum gryphiswaldense]